MNEESHQPTATKMSKITPKNLHYDSTLPSFLARLQGQKGARNEFQAARAKKTVSAEDAAEDEPVYFDEETGDSLTKKEWEEKDKADEEGEGGKDMAAEVTEIREKENVVAIGGSRKRKAGKVIGVEKDGDVTSAASKTKVGGKPEAKNEKGKPSKKAKKVKLSFGDDEE